QRARPLPACPNGRKAGQIQAPSKRTRRKYPDSAMGCCCGGKVTRTGGEVLQEALELSCTNSDTPVLYIDLACEVMEDRVAPWVLFTLPAALQADLVQGAPDANLN